jgi:hypothetical protein
VLKSVQADSAADQVQTNPLLVSGPQLLAALTAWETQSRAGECLPDDPSKSIAEIAATNAQGFRAKLLDAGAIEAFTPPAIGADWPGQHGIYAGLVRGEDGEPYYHLILSLQKPADLLNWSAAVAWAKGLGNGFALPSRRESALLFANLQDQFERNPSWHWTGTQYSSCYAWDQYFTDGNQTSNDKGAKGRARAVRRFVA